MARRCCRIDMCPLPLAKMARRSGRARGRQPLGRRQARVRGRRASTLPPMHTSVGVGGPTRREWLLEGNPGSVGEARRHVLGVGEQLVEETRLPDLGLVISEVVSNAIRHSSDAGAVLLAVTPKDDYLCVQ